MENDEFFSEEINEEKADRKPTYEEAFAELDIQQRHLACPLKSFDPFFTEKMMVPNQVPDFDEFLNDVDMVVIMVKHDHIKQNWDKLKGKVILDCHNICPLEGVYHI